MLYFGGSDPGGLESLAAAKPEQFANVDTSAEDVAIIGFTSGSTGTPKGTIHFHRDLLAAADCFVGHVVDIRPGDIVCGSPQIAFLYGLCAFLVDAPRFGASTVLLERATPELLLETIEKTRATVCFSTPSGYKLMLDRAEKFDLSSLRVCVGGGEPLAPAVFNRWREITGVSMINGLGISELLHIFISAAGEDIRPGAIGRQIPGFRVRVVNGEFEDTVPDEIGQMIVKGPNGCRYLDDEERQAKYVRDGWNLSGDLCRVDADGYIYYEARTDDMILTSGYNVSGLEVEAVLMEHPQGARMRRRRLARSRPRRDREGFRRAGGGCGGQRRGRRRVAGFREIADLRLQIPARDRVRRCPAAHRDGQDPTRSAPRSRTRPRRSAPAQMIFRSRP